MELYSTNQAKRLSARANTWLVIACLAVVLGLAGCIACCVLCTTATAQQMERDAIIISTLAGWAVIFALTAGVFPNRYALIHENNVLTGERETAVGQITIEPEVLQIPKSIAICKVVVGEGIHAQRLSVRADKVKYLSRYTGKTLKLYTVYGYIAAFEETHESN